MSITEGSTSGYEVIDDHAHLLSIYHKNAENEKGRRKLVMDMSPFLSSY